MYICKPVNFAFLGFHLSILYGTERRTKARSLEVQGAFSQVPVSLGFLQFFRHLSFVDCLDIGTTCMYEVHKHLNHNLMMNLLKG